MCVVLLTSNLLAQQKEINAVTESYFGIKDALVASDSELAQKEAKQFLKLLTKVPTAQMNEKEVKQWNKQLKKLQAASSIISSTINIKEQRAELNKLSFGMYNIIQEFQSHSSTIYFDYCPMVDSFWLSKNKAITNPYYGDKMLVCGTVKKTIEVQK